MIEVYLGFPPNEPECVKFVRNTDHTEEVVAAIDEHGNIHTKGDVISHDEKGFIERLNKLNDE